jgi:hypothetical protein
MTANLITADDPIQWEQQIAQSDWTGGEMSTVIEAASRLRVLMTIRPPLVRGYAVIVHLPFIQAAGLVPWTTAPWGDAPTGSGCTYFSVLCANINRYAVNEWAGVSHLWGCYADESMAMDVKKSLIAQGFPERCVTIIR